jgi:hypothetical protein
MSTSDRKSYLTATSLTQLFLDNCADNCECQLEMIADITLPDASILHVSDRNKYVDGVFYEALATLPTIKRTLGEWLGVNFSSWIGRSVIISIGLRDVASTYKKIFQGEITEIGGMKRSSSSFIIIARDINNKYNISFPTKVFSKVDYPLIDDSKVGTLIPFILGDYTANLNNDPAIVPAIVVNGLDPTMNVSPWTTNVQIVICVNSINYINQNHIYLKRGDSIYQISPLDVYNIGTNLNSFEVMQNTANTLIESDSYKYASNDEFLVRVEAIDKYSSLYNPLSQARHILTEYANVPELSFDTSWDYFRNKSTPAGFGITNMYSRIYITEAQNSIEYCQSIFEQLRLEFYITTDNTFKVNSLCFEDFTDPTAITYTIKDWDIEQGTLTPALDERININKMQGYYNYIPFRKENMLKTKYFINTLAVTQIGKTIQKIVVFPNLYIASHVEYQVQEMCRLSSAYSEQLTCNITWRGLLLDLGQFIKLDVEINSLSFINVPCMIRNIGVDPNGFKLNINLWSFQLIPYPNYLPSYAGTCGGYNATITQSDT